MDVAILLVPSAYVWLGLGELVKGFHNIITNKAAYNITELSDE